jgi:hypothetical protein
MTSIHRQEKIKTPEYFLKVNFFKIRVKKSQKIKY